MANISIPSLSMSRKLKSALKDWTDNITPVITKANPPAVCWRRARSRR